MENNVDELQELKTKDFEQLLSDSIKLKYVAREDLAILKAKVLGTNGIKQLLSDRVKLKSELRKELAKAKVRGTKNSKQLLYDIIKLESETREKLAIVKSEVRRTKDIKQPMSYTIKLESVVREKLALVRAEIDSLEKKNDAVISQLQSQAEASGSPVISEFYYLESGGSSSSPMDGLSSSLEIVELREKVFHLEETLAREHEERNRLIAEAEQRMYNVVRKMMSSRRNREDEVVEEDEEDV